MAESSLNQDERMQDLHDREKHRVMEQKFTKMLGPYEPMIMTIQSLLVWEIPWKSIVFFTCVHIIFWFICTTSSRFFFLLSVMIMTAIFMDTWKNRIWPEIRVPPTEPEDQDGWTPVHPRLLSVPELSTYLCGSIANLHSTFRWLRRARISHPLIFCLGNTAFFAVTATIGYHISGYMLAYIILISLMLWPSVLYHSLLRKLFHKIEPSVSRVTNRITSKLQHVISYIPIPYGLFQRSRNSNGEEEDFMPQTDPEAIAALAKAIAESEDEGGHSSIATPRMSKNPSFSNLLDDDSMNELDFHPELSHMPSFDDLDNTDDDLDLPSVSEPSHHQSSRRNELQFSNRHFAADSEDNSPTGLTLDLSGIEGLVASHLGGGDASPSSLTGALVARTISSMMESALHGMSTLSQGQMASSSSMIPRTGAKITYTCTEGGESIDFQNPEPTILESEEEDTESASRSEQVAEIEKEFDFLEDLDSDQGEY